MYKQQRVTNISFGFVFFIVFIAFFILGVFSFIYSKVTEESKKPTINPFDYLEVTYVGYSYDGEVKLSIKDNDKGFTEKDFEYKFTKDSKLSNNETITLTITSDTFKLSEASK